MLSRRSLLASAAGFAAAYPFSRTFAAAPAPLNFLAVGDWGNPEHLADQQAVAAAMGTAGSAEQIRFVVSTGDNIYPDGVASADDPRWASFEDIYTAPSLQCPWYAVLGNHDHHGDPNAEIAYSAKSSRWRMPAPYYARRETLDDGSAVDFFYLDTTPLAVPPWWEGTAEFFGYVDGQISWLGQQLQASTARWKIVVGHHPVFSGGIHGNTPMLVDQVKPLLERWGVQFYINGHDHDLQHIEVAGVHYLTTGAGMGVRKTRAIDGTLFSASSLGFLSLSMLPETTRVSFIGDCGSVLHEATVAA